jgi:hypothetical protein
MYPYCYLLVVIAMCIHSGSPMFLKSKYGVGYSLTVVGKKRCSVPEVRGFVCKNVGSDVRLLSNCGSEMTFRIPFQLANKFPEFFKALDEKSHDLKVSAYGISVTTLEEVFIRVAAGEKVADIMDGGQTDDDDDGDDEEFMQGVLGDDEQGADTDVDTEGGKVGHNVGEVGHAGDDVGQGASLLDGVDSEGYADTDDVFTDDSSSEISVSTSSTGKFVYCTTRPHIHYLGLSRQTPKRTWCYCRLYSEL